MTALRIAILQAPAPDPALAEVAWTKLLARIDDAARDEPDLVILPEASYPAWFLGAAASEAPELPDARVIGDLADRARQHGIYIAAGLILGRPEARRNAAILLSPDGMELAQAAESRPAPWFSAGKGPAASTIAGIPVALFAGADHLDPRWVEAVAESRTQLCIATGAARGWPHQGLVVGDRSEAIVATRAVETGTWFAVAGRTGVEAGAVGYGGGAGVVSPRDGWLARAPVDRAGIVLHPIEFTPPQPGVTATSPAGHAPVTADGGLTRVAALALDPGPSVVDLMESVRASIRAAATLRQELVVLPDLTGADPRSVTQAETLPFIQEVSAETHTVVVTASAERAEGTSYRSLAVIEDGRLVAGHRQSVLSEADLAAGFRPGPAPPVPIATRAGTLGLLSGREGLQPALAASLRRSGAQVLVWCAGYEDRLVAAITRTRAWEQGLPMVGAGSAAAGSHIATERGDLIATTWSPMPMLTHATVGRRRVE